MAQDELRRLSPTGAVAHQILVVEDEPATAEGLKTQLESRGFSVTVAKDGGQAHSNFTMHQPDFVILDLILKGESGYEICERMKQIDSSVPILILSVIDMADSRALADRVGADGYMTKPYDPEALVEKIHLIAERVWSKSHSNQPKEIKKIRFSCRCGKKFKVSPTHRGKTMNCPDCGETIIVPVHE